MTMLANTAFLFPCNLLENVLEGEERLHVITLLAITKSKVASATNSLYRLDCMLHHVFINDLLGHEGRYRRRL